MINRHGPTAIMHRVVRHGDTLYLGGIIAPDLSQGIGGQTTQILDRIATLLAEAGSDKSSILAATIYITDMSLKAEMNAAWTGWFAPQDLPTRATIGVSDLGPDTLLEVVVTAAVR